MSKRTEQVASEIQIIVSQLIQFELKDPRVAFCTVMGVDMSPDLQMAHVRVSVMGDADARKATLKALEHAKGFIRRQVAQQLRHLRTNPDFRFILDTSIDHSIRISELLRDNQ